MSKTRRWEKPAPAGPAAQNQSPVGVVTSFIDSLNESERASHRAAYLHLMQALTGSNVTLDNVDGTKLSGVLHTVTPFDSKHVVVVKGCKVEGDASGASDGMTIMKDFATVVSLQNTGKLDLVSRTYSTEFATDSSIKKHGDMSHLSGRNLKSVDKSWLEASGDMSLEGKSGSGKNWDQFEANRRLFNVKDTYDENLYTKRLDLKSMTAEQIANADRLAREIEGTASANIHLQEERGQATQGDWDEEDRFSGVLRAGEGTAARKAAAPVVDNNPWKRNTKLNLSGTASPVTPASTGSAGSKQPLAPPPGVPAPSSTAAMAAKKATAEAAPVAAKEKAEKPVADKVTADKKPESEPIVEAAAPAPAVAPAAASTATATSAVDPVAPEAKPAPVKKLNAAAAEFKPSWLTASTPATPAAPATPMAMPPQQFVPQQYTPNNIHYNAPSTPEMYNKQPPLHNSPNFVPPQMHMMQPESPYFDPNAPYMPPQPFMPNQPMGYEGNQYFIPPTGMMMPPPQMGSMDYMPIPMPMMVPYGQQGVPQGVPMQGHDMYMAPPMAFQQGNGHMFPPQQPQQMQMQMPMGYSPQQQPQQGGYNNMGSGQKPKYDNNNMRNNNMNKGGRGMGGRGYNNNNGNTGGRGYNSPQHHGMAGPAGPAPSGAPVGQDAPPAEGSA